jgi:hypothetical protein
LLYCLSFVVGLPWGARGVAFGYTVAVYLLALPGMWAAYRFSPVRLAAAARAVVGPAVLGLAIATSGAAARRWYGPAEPWPMLLVVGGVAIATALVVVAVWPRMRREVLGLRTLVAEIKKGLAPGTEKS